MGIIKDGPCPKCKEEGNDKTDNHLMEFHDGNKHCNRCGYTERKKGSQVSYETIEEILTYPILPIKERGINTETASFFEVRSSFNESTGEVEALYFPYTKDGKLVGFKKRWMKEKKFTAIGDIKDCELFGQSQIGKPSKMIVLTEGELDAISSKQIFTSLGKGSYRVVSLSNGASIKSVKNNYAWLDQFETIVLSLDQDNPGKKAADQINSLFSPGKVRVMSFSEKDSNDMLLSNKEKEYFQALANSRIKRPDGIISGGDTWEILKNTERPESIPYPKEWDDLNAKTYGLRIGELDTWTSGSGMGKTQVIRELQYHLLKKTSDNIGVISLEEPIIDSVEALMSLELNKRIHLPDVKKEVTEDELYSAWGSTVGTNRVHFYDHFGSVDEDSLISKIKYLAKGLNCKWIFLDHLSIVISEFASEGGERERIDTVMTKLKNLTQELGIWLGLIVHLRKNTGGKSFENGAIPTLDDLRGSGSIKQLSNSVYALSRDQQNTDDTERNTSTLHVLKCRFTGQTGKADRLFFDQKTGRMTKIDTEIIKEKEYEF